MPWTFTAALLMVIATPPTPQADCMACHSEAGMTSPEGKNLSVDPARFAASVHGAFGCEGCHAEAQQVPHPAQMAPPDCAACHSDAAQQVSEGVHKSLGPGACQGCHGPPHQLVPASDPESPIWKPNLPSTCGVCHSNPDFLSQHGIAFARPVEAYRQSIHAQAVAAGNQSAPSCSNCHGSHAIFPANDARSSINHWNVPATCGACHTEIGKSTRKVFTDRQWPTELAERRSAPIATASTPYWRPANRPHR
ncbi:MAG: hypothetical protein HY316_08065 [Acidobacteria bacterium]|nr:hypothetical protein [Acidobacteriota bacterium]